MNAVCSNEIEGSTCTCQIRILYQSFAGLSVISTYSQTRMPPTQYLQLNEGVSPCKAVDTAPLLFALCSLSHASKPDPFWRSCLIDINTTAVIYMSAYLIRLRLLDLFALFLWLNYPFSCLLFNFDLFFSNNEGFPQYNHRNLQETGFRSWNSIEGRRTYNPLTSQRMTSQSIMMFFRRNNLLQFVPSEDKTYITILPGRNRSTKIT